MRYLGTRWEFISRLAASLWCEADANCVPVWPALRRGCLPTKAAATACCTSLLCTRAVRERRPVGRLDGCSLVRSGCKLCACLAGTPVEGLLRLQSSPFSLLCTRAVRDRRPVEQACCCSSMQGDANCVPIWPALVGCAHRQRLPLPCTGAVRDHRLIDRPLKVALWCEADANARGRWFHSTARET